MINSYKCFALFAVFFSFISRISTVVFFVFTDLDSNKMSKLKFLYYWAELVKLVKENACSMVTGISKVPLHLLHTSKNLFVQSSKIENCALPINKISTLLFLLNSICKLDILYCFLHPKWLTTISIILYIASKFDLESGGKGYVEEVIKILAFFCALPLRKQCKHSAWGKNNNSASI